MQPLLVSIACGHGSSVTPMSILMPSLPVCGVVDSWARQPRDRQQATASTATMLRRMVMGCLTFRAPQYENGHAFQ